MKLKPYFVFSSTPVLLKFDVVKQLSSFLSNFIQEYRSTGVQDYRSTGVQEYRSTGVQEYWSTGEQEYRSTGKQVCTSRLNKLKQKKYMMKEVHKVYVE